MTEPYTQLLLSAVPDPARGLRTGEMVVQGEIPSLAAIGEGCPFAARCPHVMAKCRDHQPPLYLVEGKRVASCFLYENQPQLAGEKLGDLFV